MSNSQPPKTYWRSVHELEHGPTEQADEFPGLKQALEDSGGGLVKLKRPVKADSSSGMSLGRRSFLGAVGAGTALATTGCVRKPREHILPFTKRPEDLIPGKPEYYATAFQVGDTVTGVLVESQDGRPTKIEGNPKHENSRGATDGWAQASVYNIYDPDRSQLAFKRGAEGPSEVGWDVVAGELGAQLEAVKAAKGKGLALVIPSVNSPTLRFLLRSLIDKHPDAKVYLDDPLSESNANTAASLMIEEGARLSYVLSDVQTILAVDSDFLDCGLDSTRLSGEFAKRRDPDAVMNRLYAVEPHFTITGAQADHRLPLRGVEVGAFVVDVAKQLAASGVKFNDAVAGLVAGADLDENKLQKNLEPERAKFVKAVAADLVASSTQKGLHSAVIIGERQPVWVHALGIAINAALKNFQSSVRVRVLDKAITTEGLDALAKALDTGEVTTVICLGTNPAYNAPGSLNMGALLGKTQLLVHAGLYVDETAKLAHWHLPLTHYLESWGDLEASNAQISICQPLIDPLYASTRSLIEIVNWLNGGEDAASDSGYDVVRGYWKAELGPNWSEREWRRWLHDGVVVGAPRPNIVARIQKWDEAVALITANKDAAVPNEGFEVNFHIDPKVADGRFVNNPWLQELPHPMSKLTWDNAVYMNPLAMRELGLKNNDLVKVSVNGRELVAPVWEAPGQAAGTISVNVGYGREGFGYYAEKSGFNARVIQDAASPSFIGKASVTANGGNRPQYSTQDHGSLNPGFGYPTRPIVRESTVEGFKENPEFSKQGDLMKPEKLVSLWEHNPRDGVWGRPALKGLQQWGMTIDLNQCTGCNACVVACQAENNIPVVGRKEVSNGREMHWIRLDRYYKGSPENPEASIQPMLCQHCEMAPCESVCPVNATTHSPEGLNDMAYNRCVGTRYCGNNCPYKVRRFNFFYYTRWMEEGHTTDLGYNRFKYHGENLGRRKQNVAGLIGMQRNPDVTVRFRGVIEKCSFCVQRINEAKVQAKVRGYDVVKDGDIIPACQQVCATKAITFGDVADPTTAVSKLKADKRNYAVLQDLLTRPRVTYLARVRNPNPELA